MQVYLFFGTIQNNKMKSINHRERKGVRKGHKGKNSLCSLQAGKPPLPLRGISPKGEKKPL